ncbi:MAG: hypothetical protein ACTSVF_04895 [Candidatus Asgardarchaeia archaeon]
MLEKILLISSFLVLMATALEAKIKSNLGFFIVLSGLLIGILDLLYVLLTFLV